MNDHNEDWIIRLSPDISSRLGNIQHALFDFDGTISVMRQGWEDVMLPMMIESIGGQQPVSAEIEAEVRDYIDRSTGILTIRQMDWLAEAVKRHGLVPHPLTAFEYKAVYLNRLMVRVNERIEAVHQGQVKPADMMMAGALDLIKNLWAAGVTLYLASGTDHKDVVNEATVLGMAPFFKGGVYGALDQSEVNGKERIIQRILDDHKLSGNQLLVAGDGPVEIKEAKLRGAVTLGVASDEIARSGWNSNKIYRLTKAGVDLIVPDFTHFSELLDIMCGSRN